LIIASEGEILIQLDNIGAILSMTVMYLDIHDIRDEANKIILSQKLMQKNYQSNHHKDNITEKTDTPLKISKPLLLAVVVSAIYFLVSIFPKDV